jgi:hypothetical protein
MDLSVGFLVETMALVPGPAVVVVYACVKMFLFLDEGKGSAVNGVPAWRLFSFDKILWRRLNEM